MKNPAIIEIKKKMSENNINAKSLSLRTGVSQKHISKILNNKASFSVSFARKLEYPLELNPAELYSKQAKYLLAGFMKTDKAKKIIKETTARNFIYGTLYSVKKVLKNKFQFNATKNK